MVQAPTIPETIPVGIRVDESGRLRVGDSRVLVEGMLILYRSGTSPEELIENFPSMAAADLYATIAYYHQNRAEMDAWVDEIERETERVSKMVDADPRLRAARRALDKKIEARKKNLDPASG